MAEIAFKLFYLLLLFVPKYIFGMLIEHVVPLNAANVAKKCTFIVFYITCYILNMFIFKISRIIWSNTLKLIDIFRFLNQSLNFLQFKCFLDSISTRSCLCQAVMVNVIYWGLRFIYAKSIYICKYVCAHVVYLSLTSKENR